MKPIDWRSIRTHNGSQYGGFEELCTQLARSEKLDDPKAKFRRLDDPDGGIECYWEDSEGNKWGWQAKYYPTNQDPDKYYLKNIRWGDITKSIKTALKEHPELTRYYVCVPKDLTLNTDKTWNRRVIEWKALAKSEIGREVEFHWWGASELSDRLIQTEHAGRLLYWFNELIFNNEWFKDNWDVARAVAGPRYTPKIHFGLPIADKLERLGRTDHYIEEINTFIEEIKNVKSSIEHELQFERPGFEYNVDGRPDLLGIVLEQLNELIFEPIGGPELIDISKSIQAVKNAEIERMNQLRHKIDENDAKKNSDAHIYYAPSKSGIRFIEEFCNRLDELKDILDWMGEAESKRLMIITGDAYMGKTHLLCDVAKKRIKEGLPTILLMGQSFADTAHPWIQIRGDLDLKEEVSFKDFVGALEAAAQARGRRTLFIIDAINEGQGRTIWRVHLSKLLLRLNKSPWIAVVLSVRSTYKNVIISKRIRDRAVFVEHRGFEGKEYDAIKTFFPHYGLEIPSTPILNPEFSNPLFLKIICEWLKNQKKVRLPREFRGISKIFNLYLENSNKNVSDELGEDIRERYVQRGLEKFAQRMVEENERWLDLRTAKEVVNELLPGRKYKDSLYYAMLSEDLLIEDIHKDKHDIVHISYDRFADQIIADLLLSEHLNSNEPEKAFFEGGVMASLFDKEQGALEGLLEALSVQIPELTGKESKGSRELIELMPSLMGRQDARAAFRLSLIWRSLDAFSDATDEILNEMLNAESDKKDLLDTLLTVAVIPNHKYNAKFLDTLLGQYSMAERDAWWSIYLHKAYESQNPVNRLIDWGLLISPDMEIEEDVVELASIALTWMLTSSNRFLRDRATKALVALLTGHLDILHKILKRFVDIESEKFEYVNDPYVAERLYAVAYGVAMRSHDVERMGDIAQWVYDKVFANGSPPVHILLRDYARGVVERALYLKSNVNIDRELIEPPYKSKFPYIPTDEDIKELTAAWKPVSYDEGKIEWARNRIGISVISDDFAVYTLGTYTGKNSDHWLSQNSDDAYGDIRTDADQRYILKRVFDLGWTLERFGKFDTFDIGYHGREAAKAERIGKKYQWIAYHEIMAYMLDQPGGELFGVKSELYEGPWQISYRGVNIRDIDPSVTLRSNKGGSNSPSHKQSDWARGIYTEWRESDSPKVWVTGKDDWPEIEKLLKSLLKVNVRNKNWLNLEGSFVWRRPQITNTEDFKLEGRKLSLGFTGYFVRNDKVDEFMNPTEDGNANKSETGERSRTAAIFFGEYGWSPAFRSGYGLDEFSGNVRIASFKRSYSHSKFDGSLDPYTLFSGPHTSLYVPNFDLVENRELQWLGCNAEFVDADGKLAAYDPTADKEGPNSLLVREDLIRNYLKENELTLCWSIGGEKEFSYGDPSTDDMIWQYIRGKYSLGDHGPLGKLWFAGPLQSTMDQEQSSGRSIEDILTGKLDSLGHHSTGRLGRILSHLHGMVEEKIPDDSP